VIKIGCLALVGVLIAIPAIAARFLPWWGTLLVIFAEVTLLVVGGPKLVVFGLKHFALRMVGRKSRALRGAQVRVHRVEPTEKPAPLTQDDSAETEADDDDDDDDEDVSGEGASGAAEPAVSDDRRYVLVEFTLTPQAGPAAMEYYDTTELKLVPYDAQVGLTEKPTSGHEADVVEQWLIDEAGTATRDFDKLTGPARLRTIFACPPTVRGRAKFQYYFEAFGDVMIP
jgi:hypothetical protein